MEVLKKMGKFSGITLELAIREKLLAYNRAPVTAQVVIGTPGTINNWFLSKKLGTSCLNILVFDEADHMLAEVTSRDTPYTSAVRFDDLNISDELLKGL
nr:DEAD-box ATP-dependent RNA helicase 38-like [Tanacetum cinerariifolium]